MTADADRISLGRRRAGPISGRHFLLSAAISALQTIAILTLVGPITSVGRPGQPTGVLAGLIYLAVYLARMFALQGVGQNIVFTAGGLVLPGRLRWRRVRVPYGEIRSILQLREAMVPVIVIDFGARCCRFYASAFPFRNPLSELRRRVQARLEATQEGRVVWRAIAHRQDVAAIVLARRPIATWALACLCTCLFFMSVPAGFAGFAHLASIGFDDAGAALRLIDLGANAHALTLNGQVYRLVIANFLHLNLHHLLGNMVFLLVFGPKLERLLGASRFLVVALATGIASQATSAVIAHVFHTSMFAVGFSGALFGIFGALGATQWRHGRDLPPGIRVNLSVWIGVIALNILLPPFSLGQHIDVAAHAGGLLVGAAIGGAIALGAERGGLEALARPGPRSAASLLGLALATLGALAAAFLHVRDPAAHDADRLRIFQAFETEAPTAYRGAGVAVAVRAIAEDASASDAMQRAAVELAHHAWRAANPRSWGGRALRVSLADSGAMISARRGDFTRALVTELRAFDWSQPPPDHVGAILARSLAAHGPVVWGEPGEGAALVPSLDLQDGAFRFFAAAPLPRDGALLALVERGGTVRGALRLNVPKGVAGEVLLPLPDRLEEPGRTQPDPIWTDGGTRIVVGFLDTESCHCRWPFMAPLFAPMSAGTD